MLTLSQIKEMYPRLLAEAKAERRESMARFDRMVLGELDRSAPDRSGPEDWEDQWLSPCEQYENMDFEERETYWAKQRRRRVRMWRKRLEDLPREYAWDLVYAQGLCGWRRTDPQAQGLVGMYAREIALAAEGRVN